MESLRELYHKYDEIVRLSAYAFTGWFLSWVLFFIMLPFMVRAYGKIRGASLNYGFSWFSMIAIIIGLEFGLGWFVVMLLFSQKYSVRTNTFRSNFKPSNLNIWTVKFEWLFSRKYSVQKHENPKVPVPKPWTLIFQRLFSQKYSVQNCIPQNGEIYRLGFYNDGFGGCKWCFGGGLALLTDLCLDYDTMVWYVCWLIFYGVVSLGFCILSK